MPKILVCSNKKDDIKNIVNPLQKLGYIINYTDNYSNLYNLATDFLPDIILLSVYEDSSMELSKLCKKLKLINQSADIQIILLIDNDINNVNIPQIADAYINYPINEQILTLTINSQLKIKNHIDIFSANNDELAQRFYQLQVLYDTNSKLAGTLNPKKLIKILQQGLEQSISFSLSLILMINSSTDIVLYINSIYPLTKKLEQAIKLRAFTNYKSLFEKKDIPVEITPETIRTEISYKQDDKVLDYDILKSSSLFSPISTKDKFFGIVEIIRDTELSGEDTTFFQTLVSQVALPMESAVLYEEIQEKNEKLEKLEKLKSEFVSIVSHELRTPLTSIKNAMDIILTGRAGDITEKMRRFLSMGKRNVVRLSGIINDLLDLSKIEAGKMDYNFDKINLKTPVELVLSTFTPAAIEKEIELTSNIKTDEAFAYADIQKTEQLLSNLVSNALKFTNTKGKISIILSESKQYKGYWLIQVKDNGIGINEENLSKVFDKFHQIEGSSNRTVGGTGLGLPIAKEFVLSQGGDIWVESIEGKGTTFNVILPKYDQYKAFLIELELFYEKSKNAKTNFGILKIDSNIPEKITEFLNLDNKCKKIFIKNNYIYLITNPLNSNLYKNYLENLKHFLNEQKNDTISLNTSYYNFNKNIQLKDLIADLEQN